MRTCRQSCIVLKFLQFMYHIENHMKVFIKTKTWKDNFMTVDRNLKPICKIRTNNIASSLDHIKDLQENGKDTRLYTAAIFSACTNGRLIDMLNRFQREKLSRSYLLTVDLTMLINFGKQDQCIMTKEVEVQQRYWRKNCWIFLRIQRSPRKSLTKLSRHDVIGLGSVQTKITTLSIKDNDVRKTEINRSWKAMI